MAEPGRVVPPSADETSLLCTNSHILRRLFTLGCEGRQFMQGDFFWFLAHHPLPTSELVQTWTRQAPKICSCQCCLLHPCLVVSVILDFTLLQPELNVL